MRNIIRLIQKYSNLLLFLLFQMISLFFLFSWKNTYHHSVYLNASNYIVGSVYEVNSGIQEYFKLDEINKELKYENSKLKRKLYNSTRNDNPISIYRNLIDEQQYDIEPVKVISCQYKHRDNFIVINKGKSAGIRANMGVVGTKGVVGIVLNASNNYASILPVINSKFKLAIRHKRSKSFGLLLWDEKNNWTTAIVEDVPDYVKVYNGDIFETSGAAGIFPEGILIGKVLKTKKIPASQFQRIYIKLYEDFSALNSAYIINNNYQNEMLNIKQASHD